MGQPPMEQLFFHVYRTSTQMRVANGATILMSGGMNNAAGDRTVYLFVTATIMDEKGNGLK